MIEGLVGAALWAVIVSFLLGCLLFGSLAVIVRARTLDASSRHAIWLVALCTVAVMPLVALSAGAVRSFSPQVRAVNARVAVRDDSPTGSKRYTEHETTRVPGHLARDTNTGGALRSFDVPQQPHPTRGVAVTMIAVWLTGVAIGLADLFRGLVRVRRLKGRSSPLDAELAIELPWLTENGPGEREIYLRLSYEIETPVAVGFRRPVILIPTEMATQGGLRAIEGLIVHEHAHLRRRDDWINLGQRLIERVLWFNPLVWLLGQRIALEREMAADDAVVAATGRAAEYAQALWQLAREMRMPEYTAVAPGALSTRKQISIRIEALLERRPILARWRGVATTLVLFLSLGCTMAAAATAPTFPLHVPVAPSRAAQGAPVSAAPKTAARAALPSHVLSHVLSHASVPERPTVAARPEAVASPQRLSPEHGRAYHARSVADCGAACAHGPRTGAAGTTLRASDLSGKDLHGIDWRNRTLENLDLSGADLSGARLDGAHFVETNLSGANLDEASLNGALMTRSDISGASFRNARTTGLRFVETSLDGVSVHDLDLRSLVGSCVACRLDGMDLRGADLHDLHLTGLRLSGTNLSHANLNGARLTGVNLEGADLQGADLRNASFTRCMLAGVDLHGASTRGTRFSPSPPDAREQGDALPR